MKVRPWNKILIDRRIEAYTDPTGPASRPDFRQHSDFSAAEQVPVVIDGREVGQIAVRELLP